MFNHTFNKRSMLHRLALLALAVVSGSAWAQNSIQIVSSRPDTITGGDALVQINLATSVASPLSTYYVKLNNVDVTGMFRVVDSPTNKTLQGLVSGMNMGANALAAGTRADGAVLAKLIASNFSSNGPIFSGPQAQPYICQTQSFALPAPQGGNLGPAIDAFCNAPTVIRYVYRTTSNTTAALTDFSALPANVAMTTTVTGQTVPFIVRVETGTMNRGIYQNAILHNPTPGGDPAPSPFSPPKGWNKRLIAVHGVGCPGGWYIQGSALGVSPLNFTRLGEGYALFTNTLNHPSNSCNPYVAGETTSMGKEHFIETFGVPSYTVSMGNSGGAYTSLQVGDAFPGLFDGVYINQLFPDALIIATTAMHEHLMTHYFAVTNPTGFTTADQLAVTGYRGPTTTAFVDAANQAQRTDSIVGRVDIPGYQAAQWLAAVPVALRYDPTTNPTGARPTVFDWSKNVYGTDPATGFGLRTFDNTGVQYGLLALNSGAITKTQFLDLNERIGGYDNDLNYVSSRSVGAAGAIKRAHQTGVSLSGAGGLASIPVFDHGTYNDTSGYHYQWYHFALRERLKYWNGGNADNMVMQRGSAPDTTTWSTFITWMDSITADTSATPARQKTINNKPAAAVDGCWQNATTFIAQPQTLSNQPDTTCNTLFPSWNNSYYQAGGPLAANIMRCQLKPISLADYTVVFTPNEQARLNAIFPTGVCDWSKVGVGQVAVVPWSSVGPKVPRLDFAHDADIH